MQQILLETCFSTRASTVSGYCFSYLLSVVGESVRILNLRGSLMPDLMKSLMKLKVPERIEEGVGG